MKKLTIILLVIFTRSAFAQKDTVGLNISFANNTIRYERVFDAPNASKSLLYNNAGLWLAETHPYMGNSQLQLADPALSRVVGTVTAYINIPEKLLWQNSYVTRTYNFTLQIDCKDNKYRIQIYNIQMVINKNMYTPMDDAMMALINSKSITFPDGISWKGKELRALFLALNAVTGNVMTDINKNIMADNSF